MKKFDGNIVVMDLMSTYFEDGEYCFKIVLNPKKFKNSQEVDIEMKDPQGNYMPVDIRKWGRKINCIFNVTDKVDSGVCVVDVKLLADDGEEVKETLSYWVVKR